MKNPSKTLGLSWFGLAILAGLIGTIVVSAEEKPAANKVVIGKDSILIPATEMSKADRRAMNKILKEFDKSLYKIETYENGRLESTRGELADVVMDKQLASEIAANATKKGFTQFAIQVTGQVGSAPRPEGTPGGGVASHAQNPPPPPPPPYAMPSPGRGSGSHAQNSALMASSPSASPGGGSGHPMNQPPPPTRGKNAQMDSEELVKRLKPILEKYSKK